MTRTCTERSALAMRASFILNLQTAGCELFRIGLREDVIQQVNDKESDAAADSRSDQATGLLVVASKRVENYGSGECKPDCGGSYVADHHVLQGNQRLIPR